MLQQLDGTGIDAGPGEGVSVQHVCAGRARLAVAGLKSSPRTSDLMAAGLGGVNGVKSVRPSTLTGNVVVHFDPEAISCSALVQLASAILSGERIPGTTGPGGAAWHTMSVQAVAQGLMTSVQTGLSTKAANARLAEAGKNVISSKHVRTPGSILADQVTSFPVAVLAGAAVVSLVTGALIEALAISAVVGLNAAIGYFSESSAERVLASLETERAPVARLVRDGRTRELPAEEIVPGDIIQLQRGDVIPADARLIQAAGLSVSEAALTGESLPVSKSVEALMNANLPLAERTNMVYRGTVVTGGSASAIVIGTGMQTEVGRVHSLVASSRPPQTPMQRQLDELGKQLVWITGLGSALLFGLGLLRGYNTFLIARSALSLAVAAIPEGLPMIATTALAVGVERMRKRGMIVRRINAVETLASVNVVCFDKTGTLTLNQMSVAEISSGGGTLAAQDIPLSLRRNAHASDLRRLFEVCCLCSEAEFEIDAGGKLRVEGSSTEAALVNAASGAGLDPRQVRSRHPLVNVQQRSEAYRFMATLHHAPGGMLVAVKGDPIEVVSRCTRVLDPDGQIRLLTAADRAAIERSNDQMARRALRVLGFAFDEYIGRREGMTLDGLTWVGLAGLSDPVRPGVGDVIKQLEGAGVRSIMITGDGPVTARAVAAEIGLGNGRELRVVSADELNRSPASERARLASEADIFARVSPAQKLEIVRALQSSGAVVAMLGDGINDSPALRAADVGLAVGRDGGSAAKEVADIYLENEDLSLLLAGIEQGRATQDSVHRSLRFILSTNSSEMALLLAGSAIGQAEALTPPQLLWINLVTDVLPGIALTLEPPEPGLIERQPRRADEAVLGSCDVRQLALEGALIASAGMAANLIGARVYGQNSPQAQTMAFASLVGAQLLHAFNCRTGVADAEAGWSSGPVNRVVYGSLALQFAASVLPFTQRLLGVVPIAPIAGGIICGSAVMAFLASRKVARPRGRGAAASKLHFVRQRRLDGGQATGSAFRIPSSADWTTVEATSSAR